MVTKRERERERKREKEKINCHSFWILSMWLDFEVEALLLIQFHFGCSPFRGIDFEILEILKDKIAAAREKNEINNAQCSDYHKANCCLATHWLAWWFFMTARSIRLESWLFSLFVCAQNFKSPPPYSFPEINQICQKKLMQTLKTCSANALIKNLLNSAPGGEQASNSKSKDKLRTRAVFFGSFALKISRCSSNFV